MPDQHTNPSASAMPKIKHPEEEDLLTSKAGLYKNKTKKVCYEVASATSSTTTVVTASISSTTLIPVTLVSALTTSSSSSSIKKVKKAVSFKDHSLVEVIEFEDDLESKEGRKLFWELCAVDRCRFKDRVARIEPLLSPVLTSAHRNRVVSKRMVAATKSAPGLSVVVACNNPPPPATAATPASIKSSSSHCFTTASSIPFFTLEMEIEKFSSSTFETFKIRDEIKVE